MSLLAPQIDALRSLDYSALEARFLYLVATHSGYFTRRQFLTFTAKSKGWSVHQFTTKVIERGHARAVEYGRQTYVYNLYSRRIYDAIGRTNLRNRRRLSTFAVHTRLLILDLVLAHSDEHYLETEAEKVAHFRDHLGISPSIFPGRIYRARRSGFGTTTRYFVDRFPIYLPRPDNALCLPPVTTFTYCDTGRHELLEYASHLHSYHGFLKQLPAFNFVYASPDPSTFPRAAVFFKRLLDDPREIDVLHLVRYFQVRLLWETNRTATLTPADRDFLRAGDKRYRQEPFESTYRKWSTVGLSDQDIDTFLGPRSHRQQRSFAPYVLPENYNIFFAEPRPVSDREPRRQCSASRSASRSVACAG
ncbi:MAG TPA: hypothetical protein VMT20_07610 [Terriglobia bacterium]|nr:hypothetical protein [Terriglobia bacterium]